MAQIASRERRSSTSSTSSNSSSGSRSPRDQYRTFWAILEPPRSPIRISSHSTLPKSPSTTPKKQAHKQHTKTPVCAATVSSPEPTKARHLTTGLEDHARKVQEQEQNIQKVLGPTKCLTIQVSTPSKARVIIHCLRHAQAQHNIATIPRPQRLAILDPPLTSQGRLQATQLRKTLGASRNVTHVLCSPLRRTLQTALIGLSSTLSSTQKVIAYPDLREWGSSPCSTGSKMRDLLLEMKEKQENVDFALVEKGWEVNREDRGSLARRERVRRVREELFQLGQESLKVGGKWKGKDVGRALESGRNVEIVLVSHAAFLGTLEGTDIERLRNAQWRTYEFASEEEIRAKNYSPYSLVETRESKRRNDQIASPSKEPLSIPKTPTVEKLKDNPKPLVLDDANLLATKLRVARGKENDNPDLSKNDPFLDEKEIDSKDKKDVSRSSLEEMSPGSSKLNTDVSCRLESADTPSSSPPSEELLGSPLREVVVRSQKTPTPKPTLQIPVPATTLPVAEKAHVEELTENNLIIKQTSFCLKTLQVEILKPASLLSRIASTPEKGQSKATTVTPGLVSSTSLTLASALLPIPVEVVLPSSISQAEKQEVNLPAGKTIISSPSKICEEKKLETPSRLDPSIVPGLHQSSATVLQNDKLVRSSAVGDNLVSFQNISSEEPRDTQNSHVQCSKSKSGPKQQSKVSCHEIVKTISPTSGETLSVIPELQADTSKETLEVATQTSISRPDKIHRKRSKDKLRQPRSPASNDTLSSARKSHRKRSKDQLQSLPEEALIPPSLKRSHTEKFKDKSQTPGDVASSTKKLHLEKSKDKLKSSRSRSSTPDETPLTLRKLFAEMSKEKAKRSSSPETAPTSSSVKKLQSERSKDKLKSQRRHLQS